MKKQTFLALALAAAISGGTPMLSAPAQATGIPTLDIASLSQALMDYTEQLAQYSEMIEQTVLNQQQLVEAINLYEQALTSYNQVLRQMEGLKSKLDPQQWEEVMAKYGDIYNLMPSKLPNFNSPEMRTANNEVGNLYYRGDREATNAIFDSTFEGGDSDQIRLGMDRAYLRSQAATSQAAQANAYQEQLSERGERLNILEENRMALGDSDELATMQFIAEQNQVTLDSLQQLVAVNNSQLQGANQLESQMNANLLKASEASVRRAQAREQAPITVDKTKFVTF